MDIDELCDQFATKTKTKDCDDEWEILIEMIGNLNSITNDIRYYMDYVVENVRRYDYSFINTLSETDTRYHSQIREYTREFMGKWDFFLRYEELSSEDDLLLLRDMALRLLKYIKTSAEDSFENT